jgi:hypothetical protein
MLKLTGHYRQAARHELSTRGITVIGPLDGFGSIAAPRTADAQVGPWALRNLLFIA